MNSRTRLDYALFQLTPTRTRCDLVVFAADAKEKLASGLLQPFLSHLNYAKDEIAKGGYSITLRPPSNAIGSPNWFTKATLERFVRFVNTPEVLERFVTIEKELLQIETSVQSTEHATAVTETEGNLDAGDGNAKRSAAVPKGESDDATEEEDSKIRLQRVLETRKAVLRKEQAMAYARALVGGFEMDCIDHLLSFADAFGASRLKEACINFIELCNKKNGDHMWMDEVAAMQAYTPSELPYLGSSGIILASDTNDHSQEIVGNVHNGSIPGGKWNGSVDASASDSTRSHGSLDTNQDYGLLPTSNQMQSTDAKAQLPMSWCNKVPQYMQNFQGQQLQQMPPFFPGMQVAPQYYPGNIMWPPHLEDSCRGFDQEGDYRKHKSSKKKERFSLRNGKQSSKPDRNRESSDSSSGSGTDESEEHVEQLPRKKHGKRSSRKVVIRNINYITSNRDGERGSASEGIASDEDDKFIDGDSLKQQVEEAVGSLERHHKSTSQHNKNNKKSVRSKQQTIVNRSNGSADDDMENAAANTSNGIERNESWDIFQSLLLRDSESRTNGTGSVPLHESSKEGAQFRMESAEVLKNPAVPSDSFVVNDRNTNNEVEASIETFESEQGVCLVIKKDNTYEEELLKKTNEGSENLSSRALIDCFSEASIIKSQKGEDLLFSKQLDKSAYQDESIDRNVFFGDHASPLSGDYFQTQNNKKDILVDDSLMVQVRPFSDLSDSHLRTDIFMVSDIAEANQPQSSKADNLQEKKAETNKSCEPDDLCMVLERDSTAVQTMASWNPEMDYENNNLASEVEISTGNEPANSFNAIGSKGKASEALKGKVASKEAKHKASVGALGKSKSNIVPTGKKSTSGGKITIQKSKAEKEEENRKRMEEILIQRQNRIAQRSTASGLSAMIGNKTSKESKTSAASMKDEKKKIQASADATKRVQKPILRSSNIDRLAAARVETKLPSSESKPSQSRKATTKEIGVMDASMSQKKAGSENKKLTPNKVKPSDNNNERKNRSLSLVSDTEGKKDHINVAEALPVKSSTKQATQPSDGPEDLENIKELHSISSIEKSKVGVFSQRTSIDDESSKGILFDGASHISNIDQSAQVYYTKGDNEVISKSSPVLHKETENLNDLGVILDKTMHPLPISPNKAFNSTPLKIDDDGIANEKLLSGEISVIELSTPPPNSELSPEPFHPRKKWSNGEPSPKAVKGFKKLLLFGRKS